MSESNERFLVHIERVSGDEGHSSVSYELGSENPRQEEPDYDGYCENIICPTEARARVVAAAEASDQAVAQSSDGGVWMDLIGDEEDDAYETGFNDLADYMRGIDLLLGQPIPATGVLRYTFNGGHFIEISRLPEVV